MALTPIDQYKYGLKKMLSMHFESVDMNRGQNETTYYLKIGVQTEIIKIDNTELEECLATKKMPAKIKELCK